MDLSGLPEEARRQDPFVSLGPGSVYEIRYRSAAGTTSYYNLADIEAFRARLHDPQFRLIE